MCPVKHTKKIKYLKFHEIVDSAEYKGYNALPGSQLQDLIFVYETLPEIDNFSAGRILKKIRLFLLELFFSVLLFRLEVRLNTHYTRKMY